MSPERRITAVLGPTNTGKTHLAMERMLGHRSGVIGFPLRLLARENYDRAAAIKGHDQVALITGEEKIVPPSANYVFATVESMPLDRRADFLAVDEIQLCADPERGHIFTDRLLSARGDVETMFLGSETIKPVLKKLVPDAECISRPRLSRLTYAGSKKLTRLPRRSAVVAFSASDVYGIAELVRRQRGGAAVVLGALSPRTRNAQVALFQSGEVDYIIATDAIGMGLNMDVNHVAFASLSKFDGVRNRALDAQEVAQIAGRAGRHMNDGTFGVTAEATSMEPDLIDRVESHTFQAVKSVQWRNPNLRFQSIDALLNALRAHPERMELKRAKPAADQVVLEMLARDEAVRSVVTTPDMVKLLWDVARVPDFHAKLADSHARLLAQMFHYLRSDEGHLPEDWVAEHIKRIDKTDGDMHALMDRIAAIRVWTYVSNRGQWLHDTAYWQETTRAVEDRLSDALHDKLTQQFVDRRTSVLMQRLHANDHMAAAVDDDGAVEVEGHFIGRLDGLTFQADTTGRRTADRAVMNAASAALRPKLRDRVDHLSRDSDTHFTISDTTDILWRSAPVGRLAPGTDTLHPGVIVPADDHLEPALRDRVTRRLEAFVTDTVSEVFEPLLKPLESTVSGAAQGLMFQLTEGLGSQRRSDMAAQVKALTDDDRKALNARGVRFGVDSVYVPKLLKAEAQRLRALLWMAEAGRIVPLPPEGRVSFDLIPDVPHIFYRAAGYRVIAARGYRLDMMERFAASLRALVRDEDGIMKPDFLSLLGITMDQAGPVTKALGFKLVPDGEVMRLKRRRTRPPQAKAPQQKASKNPSGASGAAKSSQGKRKAPPRRKREKPINPDSPFAVLKDLVSS